MLASMKLRCLASLALALLAACGGEDEQLPDDAAATVVDSPVVVDAPPNDGVIVDAAIDAALPIDAASTVQLIPNCTGIPNPDLTVSAATGTYVPANPTIGVNDVIRFEPGSSVHDMDADNGEFGTALGEITCLRFTAAGTFPVHCSVHQFTTTITVQ